MKVAAIQVCVDSDYKKNLKKVFELMKIAVTEGAKLITLPENFSFVRVKKDIPFKYHTLDGELVLNLRSFARKFSVAVLVGSFIEKRDGYEKFFNTSLFIDDRGEIVGIYRKVHLFDVLLDGNRGFFESNHFEGGEELTTVKFGGFTFGMTICYDLRFPEIFRKLVKMGVNVFLIPSAFTMRTGRDHWEILLRARAIENLSYVIAPALWGKSSDKIVNNGRSMIIDPWGNVLATSPDMDSVIFARLDFEYLIEKRKILPSLNHVKLI